MEKLDRLARARADHIDIAEAIYKSGAQLILLHGPNSQDLCTVSLRVNGKLRHIGVGRTHARTHVKLLIKDLNVTIINAATGEILRELTIDTTRDYQPIRKP